MPHVGYVWVWFHFNDVNLITTVKLLAFIVVPLPYYWACARTFSMHPKWIIYIIHRISILLELLWPQRTLQLKSTHSNAVLLALHFKCTVWSGEVLKTIWFAQFFMEVHVYTNAYPNRWFLKPNHRCSSQQMVVFIVIDASSILGPFHARWSIFGVLFSTWETSHEIGRSQRQPNAFLGYVTHPLCWTERKN